MSQVYGRGTSSTTSFFTALIANSALLLVEVGLFLVLKQRIERIYGPRTYLPPPEKRSPKLPSGPWKWLPALINARAEDIIDKNGLDAYMFLRFLKMLVWIFLVFTILTFAIIVPVDFIGQHGASSNLEKITWTNITDDGEQGRFIAHIVVVYILTIFVIFVVRREMSHFVLMRQRFLLSPTHSRLAQARTVLITSVPDTLSTESSIRQFASFVPGGVERVWLHQDTKHLNDLFDERNKRCMLLEKAISEVLNRAVKEWKKKERARKRRKVKGIPRPRGDNGETGQANGNDDDDDERLLDREPSQKMLDELVPLSKRPKRRAGPLGVIGKKVDVIEWCKDEIINLNTQISSLRTHEEDKKFLGSVFILCNLQIGAHILAQCVSYHQILEMNDKFIETHPDDIVWHNLDDDALKTRSKVTLSWIITFALIIVYSFPVAAVGSLSNLQGLCRVSWLRWLCLAPAPLPSIIQGLLPPVLLASLFAVVPVILKGLAWYEGLPRQTLISVSLYRRFFLFLLIHGFLIVTISSGLTGVIEEIIDNPTHTVQHLATKLPAASVFFLTYMITQGLAGAGTALAQLFPLGGYYFGKWFLGRTPRQAFNVTFLMPSADFGKLLPRLSLLATIGLAYSALNPLINLLAFICFGCYYIAWKFLFLQVFDQPAARESGGEYFPMAASNLFVGLYIEQICLASLFFLKASVPASKTLALTQGILMLILVAITIWAHLLLNRSFAPLSKYLPMSLATTDLAERLGHSGGGDGEVPDLFSKDFVQTLRKRMGKQVDRSAVTFDALTARIKSSFDFSVGGSSSSSTVRSRDLEAGNVNARGNSGPSVSKDADGGTGVADTHEAATLPSNEVVNSDSGETAPSAEADKTSPQQESAPPERPAQAEETTQTRGSSNSNDASSSSPASEPAEGDSLDKHAFDHPSTYVPQPCIWIPRDPLGLCRVLVEHLEGAGVAASDEGATMDWEGIVEVTKPPPVSR